MSAPSASQQLAGGGGMRMLAGRLLGRLREPSLSLQLMVLSGIQIAFSFGMQWYVALAFGAHSETDALYAGMTLTQMTVTLLIESFTVAFVPLLTAVAEEAMASHVWSLLILSTALFGALAVILYGLAPLLMPLVVAGFSRETQSLTVTLTRIQVAALPGTAACALLTSMYQVRKRFLHPPLAVVLASVVFSMLMVWRLKTDGLALAAWVQVGMSTLPAVLMLPAVFPGVGRGIPRDLWKNIWTRSRPVILGKAYFMTSFPIDRFLASFLQPGGIVTLELASRFYGAALRVLGHGILTPFFPALSKLAQEENWEDYRKLCRHQTRLMLGLTVAVAGLTVGLAALGWFWASQVPAEQLAGRLSPRDVKRLCAVLICMAGLVPCSGMANLLTQGFHAQGDTGTPARIGVIVHTVGIGFKFAGYYYAGLAGIALAVTAWAAIYCFYLRRALESKIALRISQQNLPAASLIGKSI